jgi:cell division protein ZapA (FtsZ GTPase activity inhibitor)
MTQQTLTDLNEGLSEAIAHLNIEGPVVLQYEGKSIAALISIDDLQLLEKRLEEIEDIIDSAAVEKVLSEPSDAVPYEEFRKELGLS